jgi:nickel-dependent lactate racemase
LGWDVKENELEAGVFSSIKKGLSSINDKLSNVKERITIVFTDITKLNPSNM